MEIKYYFCEIWKDIYFYDKIKKEWVDFRGYYQVSNFGRVRSVDRYVNGKTAGSKLLRKGKILAQSEDSDHYLVANLSKNGKTKQYKVHRLVAYIFIPNLKNLLEVNHLDENKQNNMCTNLEWCTNLYNIRYGTALKRRANTRKERHYPKLIEHITKLGKQHKKTIQQYTLEGSFVTSYDSVSKAAELTKIPISTISACLTGRQNQTRGFVWKYE